MSWPTGNITVTPNYPDEGSGYVTQPEINYYWPKAAGWETQPCSCGLAHRHLWATHWFRLVFTKERWS